VRDGAWSWSSFTDGFMGISNDLEVTKAAFVRRIAVVDCARERLGRCRWIGPISPGRLDIAGIIEPGACQIREVSLLGGEQATGRVIEALIANRLKPPEGHMARPPFPRPGPKDWAVGSEVYGIDADTGSNDETGLGGALDAVSPTQVGPPNGIPWGQAIAAFGIAVTHIQWDMTSFSSTAPIP